MDNKNKSLNQFKDFLHFTYFSMFFFICSSSILYLIEIIVLSNTNLYSSYLDCILSPFLICKSDRWKIYCLLDVIIDNNKINNKSIF
jgi:hypothetical protein